MRRPFFLPHAAVQDRGGAAIGAETRRRHIGRHDLAAALRTRKDLHAVHVVFLRVLRLLIFIGVELCLTVIAHERLRCNVKAQITAAIGAIVHRHTLSAAVMDSHLRTKVTHSVEEWVFAGLRPPV